VVLKYLGDMGIRAKDELNICGAAVTCVPFDPVASQGKLDQGFNRAVYSEVCMYAMQNGLYVHVLFRI
jgi:predicted alpha/beta-fold hydrolase